MKSIAIIPARGGSKRIPRKNIKEFCGKPIICYSIETALKSGFFEEVMVSTDDQEIAEVSKKAGASVPFLRSQNASSDTASMEDVAIEVLEKYKQTGRNYDTFCCLLPTAPLISVEDIKTGMNILEKEKEVASVFTITRFSYPIQRALKINGGWVSMQWPQNMDKRSQELEPMYHDAGQLYCLKTEPFLKEKLFFSSKSKAIVLPETRVQDIDTIEDWKVAEAKFLVLNKGDNGIL